MRQRGWLGAALLITTSGCARSPDAATPAPVSGGRLYAQNCVPCHRDDGRGVAGVYPSLAGSPVVNGDPVELARWVLNGERPASMPAGRYPAQMMRFAWLKDADAALLLSHVRGSFGNHAAPLDAATIARARAGESR